MSDAVVASTVVAAAMYLADATYSSSSAELDGHMRREAKARFKQQIRLIVAAMENDEGAALLDAVLSCAVGPVVLDLQSEA
jgi:hypothetical protein